MTTTVLGADVLGTPTTTYRAGLIGSGIRTSASPALHETEAAAHGIRARFALLDLDELGHGVEVLEALLRETRRAGWQGVTVTHPAKQTIMPLLDEVSADAAAIGAVNTVVFDRGRAIGHNTDWSGHARSLRTLLPGGLCEADLRSVVVVGAGGAGSAVGHALLTTGVAHLSVVDVDVRRASALATALQQRHPERTVRAAGPGDLPFLLADASGVVNASPVGMTGHEGRPVPSTALRPDLWVNDIVYRPRRTCLLAAAERAGCRVLGGGPMVALQAADGFALLTGLRADPDRMLATFEATQP
ncbi:shikimate dehydrogenase [Pseudonocardia oroxyli]|uniref:Shikimate dehydrogenase n=1 Tax=Pseudonocardia oroxyli TaxID=366584 RepID=A0A1G8CB96_PSEOR|nr:shikimate dehydrogenase [Pseudonocardia oroxyli]SDH42682.1 shikimate dehydrogenase [Pseudonocardia oroxyli]